MLQSVRTLMAGLLDYAGLFPPAKLGMQAAVEAFNRARISEWEWMLGRFVCPASRLPELSAAAASLMPGTHATSGYREHADIQEPWRVSVLIDGDLLQGIDAMGRFNQKQEKEDSGLAVADTLEFKVSKADQIDDRLEQLPEDIFPFV